MVIGCVASGQSTVAHESPMHRTGLADEKPPPSTIIVRCRRMREPYGPRTPTPAMTFTIRELSRTELASVTPMRRAMIEEIDGIDLDAASPGWHQRWISFFGDLIDRGQAAVWVAQDGRERIGTAAAYLPVTHRSAVLEHPSAYICNVYVAPPWRRRGLATALTTRALQWARKKGCSVARLRTSSMGRPVYERLGFRPSNELELTLAPEDQPRRCSDEAEF